MLHCPIIFKSPLKIDKPPHGLRDVLIYVEIDGDSSRLPSFASLDLAALGLCSVGSISPMGGRGVRKDRVVLRPAK